ncbi:MAG TPA: polyprenol monophosphomannose synthase [Candidatus Limnocylindrales bacterium]|nr:polyprenol monophosphomannose synthase [Candidatus Limnocylindrales bacterium]
MQEKDIQPFIILPTYNERENIHPLVQRIIEVDPRFCILIIDDNSPDGTGKLADELAEKFHQVHTLHRKTKMGLGTAYITGFKYALSQGAEYIFEMDADFSHDPSYLPQFLEAIQDSDLVIGSRYINGIRVEGWRFRRLLMSKLANMYASYIMVQPIWDFTSGFRCYRRAVLERINFDEIHSDGYAFQIEMVYHVLKNGFKVKEIPILFRERKHGYSKISRKIVWEAFWTVLKLRAPLKVILYHAREFFKDDKETLFNR